MKELSPDDRPREKLLRHGAPALGDNELVALVLGSGRRGPSALALANELLTTRGGLHGLVRSTCDDLAQNCRHRPREGGADRRRARARTPHAHARAQRAHAAQDAARGGRVSAARLRVAAGRAIRRRAARHEASRASNGGAGDRDAELNGRPAARRISRGGARRGRRDRRLPQSSVGRSLPQSRTMWS